MAISDKGHQFLGEVTRSITIFFEAHATSLDNELGIASGQRDSPLSCLGRAQAIELGRRYREVGLSFVYCSDLLRSRSTAEIAFSDRRHLIRVDPRLRECDYGALTGKPQKEIAESRKQFVNKSYPGGESYIEAVERIRCFLSDVWCQAATGYPALIIGHRATQYGLECTLCEKDLVDVVGEVWAWQPGWVYMMQSDK